MPANTKPEFKIGDIVVSQVTGEKCVVVDFEAKAEELEPEDLETLDIEQILKIIADGQGCAVTDFEESTIELVSPKDIELCDGLQNKALCFHCECLFNCPESDFKLSCYTEGKLDRVFCDRCKYRLKCWSNKK